MTREDLRTSSRDLMLVGGSLSFERLHAQMEHVHYDKRVNSDDREANPSWPVNQVGHFEWNVDGPRDKSQPLGPRQGKPESVGFDEPEDCVNAGDDGDFPKANVADPINQIDEDADVVVVGIDMKELEEALGHPPDIPMAHGKNAEAGEQHDYTFTKFNGGDGAHALDVLVIVDWTH
jgi:hypothetical protein